MPDFIPVLVTAILLFLALLLFFGGSFIFFPGAVPSEPQTFTLGSNFNISYGSGEVKFAELNGNVTRGIASGMDKSISFSVTNFDDLIGAKINLFVSDSNLYGKFIVDVNGFEVYRDFAYPGQHVIFVKEDYLKSQNVVRFDAESSGWRFWAPTAYIFTSNTTGEYVGTRTRTFQFNLTDAEHNSATSGSVIITGSGTGSGRLIIKVNGYEVYKGPISITQDFPSTYLLSGTNTVELTTEPFGSYVISRADVTVYFGKTNQTT